VFVHQQLSKVLLSERENQERLKHMNVSAHIDALHDKHAHLETCIIDEQSRPMPDFTAISELKKRKLKVKEEIELFEHAQPKRANG
jgi:hypothetical protein